MDDELNPDEQEVLETLAEEDTTNEEDTINEEEKEEDTTNEEVDKLKKENEELAKKNKQLFERAKKTEQKTNDGMSNRDVLVLAKSDIHQDDIDDVLEYAKFKNISVAEAIKSPVVKSIINEHQSERETLQATHTRKSARGSSQVTGEDILIKAETTGEVPDSEEDLQRMFMARQKRKK